MNGTRWCAVLLRKGVRQPREISLHIPKGLLFFTDWAHEMAKIQRVGMDGTHAEAIVTENLHWPNGITVDAVAQRIYWSDAKHDLLESAKFDGSDRRQTKVLTVAGSKNNVGPLLLLLFKIVDKNRVLDL